MSEIQSCIDTSFTCCCQKIIDHRERVSILLADFVQSPEIDAKSERTIFLANEEDWCTVRGFRRSNESNVDVLVNEFSKGSQFRLRKGIHRTNRRRSSVFKVDFEVIKAMWSKSVGLAFAEYICVVVILFRNL